jgi:hypothetical protein
MPGCAASAAPQNRERHRGLPETRLTRSVLSGVIPMNAVLIQLLAVGSLIRHERGVGIFKIYTDTVVRAAIAASNPLV